MKITFVKLQEMMILRKIAFVLAAGSTSCAWAQHLGVAYATEFQAGAGGKTNWVNMLRMEMHCPLGRGFSAEAATISVARTLDGRVAGDMLVFSNIEEDNLALAPAVLGVGWNGKRGVSVFVGVRNLNEDYFTSPCTSLFTNSSCGIFPTLSANYALANYPVASMCADLKWDAGRWQFETSLYNGTGYSRFAGRENVFRFCPVTDGAMSVTSVNYQDNGSSYYMGFALCGRMCRTDEEGAEGFEEKKEKGIDGVAWAYAEQQLCRGLYALLQYSCNPSVRDGCRHYAGAGLVALHGKVESGLFAGYAGFVSGYEFAAELTCKVQCVKHGYLQPALHLISGSNGKYAAGLLRFGWEI